ncbi:HAMP domain-containing protein [Marinobacter sp.]|uniref:HAMP domain-containing protein n=1 Tax=Marinobacter sp. TaxID=50741 RepID=UPI003A922227
MVILLVLVAAVLGGSVLPRVLRLNSAIRSIADGEADLTRRVNMKGNDELTKMARSVNQFIARIQELVSDVKRRGLFRQFSCKAVYGPPGTLASVLRPELQR